MASYHELSWLPDGHVHPATSPWVDSTTTGPTYGSSMAPSSQTNLFVPPDGASQGSYAAGPQDLDPGPKSSFISPSASESYQSRRKAASGLPKVDRPWHRIEIRQWVWEAVNALLLIAILVAIVVTLYVYAGQPLPQWPLHITINTLLSVYAIVFRASMALILTSCISQLQWRWYLSPRSLKDLVLYHRAGQGPIGSLFWLLAHHLRHPLTALAAIITIVAIAVDPFVQQLVQSVECTSPISVGGGASVARTNYLEYDALPNSLQPLVISGFYTAQNFSNFECATGNCTFSNDYSSLAFCSQCDDVSSSVSIEKDCLVFEGNDVSDMKPGVCDGTGRNNVTTTSWNITTSITTPKPFSVNFYKHISLNQTVIDHPNVFGIRGSWRMVDVMVGNITTSRRQGTDLGVIFPLADTAIFGDTPASYKDKLTGCSDAQTNDTWYCRGYGAASCVVQPCVRTYTTSIEAGQISEVMTGHSDPMMNWGFADVGNVVDGGLDTSKGLFGLLDKSCVTDHEHQQLIAAGYQMDGDSRWLAYNITFNPVINVADNSSSFPESLLAHGCLYIIDEAFVSTLWSELLGDVLLGSVQRYSSASSNQLNTFSGSQQLLYMFNSGNVNMTAINNAMGNLAQALTLWVRSNGGDNYSEPALGDAFRVVTCLQVRWLWLILPVTLLVLTFVVLALTVTLTAVRGLPVWKSSPLALLFHGPGMENWVDENLLAPSRRPAVTHELMTERGMEGLADRVWVKLVDESQGLRLRQVGVRQGMQ